MASAPHPSQAQLRWLRRGLAQPGGKLPLFDERGVKIGRRTVEACVAAGWAVRWFDNPLKPDWLVCKLTPAGRIIARGGTGATPIGTAVHT